MPEFTAEQIINGVNGALHITRIGGNRRLLGNVMNIIANVNVDRRAIKIPGKYNASYKRMGWTGEGSMVLYRVNSMAWDAMRDTANQQTRQPIFELEMALNDADSSYAITGRDSVTRADAERIALKKVKTWTF